MESDSKINYSIRPSKSIERNMILEVLKEVCPPTTVNDYRYIGFGSCFFIDFKMFHRSLSIKDMISIEGSNDEGKQKRCFFNRPFNCIDIKFGFSTDILPKIGWDKKSIVWLDYDDPFDTFMFEDIQTCMSNLKSSSLFIITLEGEFFQKSIDEFYKYFGEQVPSGLKQIDIEPLNCIKLMRKLFIDKINEVLVNTYSAVCEQHKLIFKQLFNITYKDSKKMYTFGGMVINKSEEKEFLNFKFNSYPFITDSENAIDISFPIITNKEYHHLNNFLPSEKQNFINNPNIDFIPESHKISYFDTYRFYPPYIEIKDF